MRIQPVNSRITISLLVLYLTMPGPLAFSQSLSVQLKAEPVQRLAQAARQKGSAVRGAILFTQPNLSCTRCHAGAEGQQLGPDLTQYSSDSTDVYLVESLLDPSKVIRKGYESVTVVTTSGKTIAGRIVERNADRLTLRDASGDLPLVELAQEDIDEIAPSKLSAMPANLVDQLKDRGQFLDLVRYLMELNAAAKTATEKVDFRGGKTVRQELEGIVLLSEFNCSACHSDGALKKLLPPKQAPDLSWAAGRLDPDYIKRFIADPWHLKPGTSMPDVMSTLSLEERQAAAEEITHYLMSRGERSFTTQPIAAEAAQRGRESFHTVGCVACHSPRNEEGRELLPETSVPLGRLEGKYNRDGLVAFLKNPLQHRPSGRMPKMKLTHWEAVDIASYLLSTPQGGRPVPEAFRLDQALAEKGKVRFQQLRCGQCHQGVAKESNPISLPLSEVDPKRGCLSGDQGPWPQFHLTDQQREAIKAGLPHDDLKLSQPDQIAVSLRAFRCLNCHQRDDLGGVSARRNRYFKTTNPNLGPQGRIPPTLTNVGAKLKPQYMRQVLVSGRAVRPYVLTRMPQYGTENVAHLADLFQQVDRLPPVQFAHFRDQKEMRKIAAEMVGTGGLNCIACHTFRRKKAANMPAVDLTEMAERLEKNWFYHYMREPQRFSQNTVMPSFWPGGRAMRKDILNGDADRQIEALWQYLLDGRQARTPRGLIREPIELLATEEAVMLRRKYQGIGKRGIGVGYPSQVNLAFDAEQIRLAMIWKGKFADPGGVWRGQGHGVVRPLGKSLIRFGVGPDLDDAEKPWIVDEGRPPHHQFKGYSLDEKMRPRFKYRFADLSVEDFPLDVLDTSTGRPFIRRTVTVKSLKSLATEGTPRPEVKLIFRAATGKSIQPSEAGSFVIDDQLEVHIDKGHTGKIVDRGDFKQLCIPLQLVDGSASLTLEYKW